MSGNHRRPNIARTAAGVAAIIVGVAVIYNSQTHKISDLWNYSQYGRAVGALNACVGMALDQYHASYFPLVTEGTGGDVVVVPLQKIGLPVPSVDLTITVPTNGHQSSYVIVPRKDFSAADVIAATPSDQQHKAQLQQCVERQAPTFVDSLKRLKQYLKDRSPSNG